MDRVNQFEFKPRDNNLSVNYQQPLQMLLEKLEQKQNQQSILN